MQKVTFDHASENKFSKTVAYRIADYFTEKNISRKANWIFGLKVILFFFFTVGLYVAIMTSEHYNIPLALLFILFGLFITMLVFSVAQDASHHAISDIKWVN